MNMQANPLKLLIIGGPDVDSRIPIIERLNHQFFISVLGSDNRCKQVFQRSGIEFSAYQMNRGSNPIDDLYMFFSLIGLISRNHADIVHTFDTKPGVWGRLAARLSGVPVVIGTLPGLGSLYARNDLKTRITRGIYQLLQKLACHLSDLTVFQNREDAEKFIKDGVVPRRKTVILDGSGVQTGIYDPRKFAAAQRQQMRVELGLDPAKIVMIMAARLIRSKGVLEFARAAGSVRERYPNTAFLLVGANDPESVDAITPEEQELIARSVTCLGTRNDLPQLLAISDVFVLPTYYREGVPRVLLEAASMGLPIVATEIPGCTTIVEDNVNGFLVQPREADELQNAIMKLVTDPLRRQCFGEASRQRAVSRFDLSIISTQTASIYNQLLEQKGYGNPAYS